MFETLKSLLIKELNIDESLITPEAELVKDLNINSLELADLILLCEEECNISIEEEDYKKFLTVRDVVDFLEKKSV